MDAHKNFPYSTVTVAPSPASSGLTLSISDGAAMPDVPFNAVVCPASTQPLRTNGEIVRVTTNAAGALVIARTQEGSTAREIVVGDQFFAGITAKTFTDIEAIAGVSKIIAGANVTLSPSNGLGDVTITSNVGNLDGGVADSLYGGTTAINGGTA